MIYPRCLRQSTLEAIELMKGKRQISVLEIGPGGGGDTLHMLDLGFEVTAVDPDEDVISRLAKAGSERLKTIHGRVENIKLPEQRFNLIIAQNVLSFVRRDDLPFTFTNLITSLHQGGVVSCNFFGVDDEWNTTNSFARKMTFLKEKEVRRFLTPLDIIKFREEKYFGGTMEGKEKFWHVFDVIAVKKDTG